MEKELEIVADDGKETEATFTNLSKAEIDLTDVDQLLEESK